MQETASDGSVTFTSIYPVAYDGRWPHIRFEVYPSLGDDTSASDNDRDSQRPGLTPPATCARTASTTSSAQFSGNQ